MLIYAIIFAFFIFFIALADRAKRYSNLMYLVVFAGMFLLSGFRGDVGQDTLSYGRIYSSMVDLEELGMVLKRQEPFMNLLMYIHKQVFDSYTGFLVLVAFIQVVLLNYATRRIYHRNLFLVFYLFIFFLELQFNVIRVGLGVLFFLAALSDVDEKPKKAVLWSCLAVFSHVTVLVVFPVLLARAGLSVKRIIITTVLGFLVTLVVVFWFSELILSKALAYGVFDALEFRLPLVITGLLLIILMSLLITKNKSIGLSVSVSVLLVTFAFYSFSDIAYRLMNLATLVFMFLLFEDKALWRASSRFNVKPVFYGGLTLLLWFSFTKVGYLINEPSKRYITGEGSYEFSYIPYELYNKSKYRID